MTGRDLGKGGLSVTILPIYDSVNIWCITDNSEEEIAQFNSFFN